MNRKRQLRKDRIFLLAVIAVLLLLGIYFCIRFLFQKDVPDNPPSPVPVPEKDTSAMKVDLIDYEVYDDAKEEMGFRFVIARIRFSDEKAVSYDLKDLVTSEGIILSDTSSYVSKLEEKGYYLSKKNVSYDVKSADNSYTCFLFVPYEKDDQTLYLDEHLQGGRIEIDLKQNLHSLEELKYSSGGNIIDPRGSYDIHVSDSFISTMMWKGEDPYEIPSSCSVYTFKLSVNAAENGVILEGAQFVQSSTGEVYDALGKEYASGKLDNILGKNLRDVDDTMGLFFEVYEQGDRDYRGKLRLKFSNSENWIEISTELR